MSCEYCQVNSELIFIDNRQFCAKCVVNDIDKIMYVEQKSSLKKSLESLKIPEVINEVENELETNTNPNSNSTSDIDIHINDEVKYSRISQSINLSDDENDPDNFSSDEELDELNKSLKLKDSYQVSSNSILITKSPINIKQNKYHMQYDSVHGLIKISEQAKRITEHYVFNRLRDIKQLGPLHYKFGYGNHSRYEHSIGVGYLSRYAGQALQKKHSEITDREILCLELAGMCHDIGHGAYSHTFDNLLEEIKCEHPCQHHEIRSQVLFQFMIDDLHKSQTDGVIDLTEEEVLLVQYFIDPEKFLAIDLQKYRIKPTFHLDGIQCKNIKNCKEIHLIYTHLSYESKEIRNNYQITIPKFYRGLEQVVSNYHHKLDVDKIDYLLRDSRELRFEDKLLQGLDIFGFLDRAMIIDDIWMFNIRDQLIVYNLICCRFLFYTSFYLHPDVNAINCMLTDAMRVLNTVTSFAKNALLENANQIHSFCTYTDNKIIEYILNTHDERISHAKLLIENIMNKKWYKHMGDFITSIEELDDTTYTELRWKVFTDKSTPTNLLPKVRYHQNGIPVNTNKITELKRLYMK